MININKLWLGFFVALIAPTLWAQDDTLEEVVVTGTRITADGYESVSPVNVITAEEIRITGQTRIEDILNTLPQIETSGTSGFGPDAADGTATLDLRGLGASRTLVLLNGRRLAMGGIYSENPDVGQIPVSLLERVDVLTGGASAVYGSDAMAGAVNFVTREIEGVEISIQKSGYRTDTSNTADSVTSLIGAKGYPYPTGVVNDGSTTAYDIVMGTGNANGHITMYVRHAENEAIFNRDRAFSACALSVSGESCSGSANTPIPHFDVYPILNVTASSNGDFDLEEQALYEINLFGQLQADGSILDTGQGTGRYNYAAVAMLALPGDRDSAGAIGRYRVSNRLETYFEINYSSFKQRANIAESGTFGNDYMDLYWDNSNLTNNPAFVDSVARNMSETDYMLAYSACIDADCDEQWKLPAGVEPGDTVTLNYLDDDGVTQSVTGSWDGINTGIYKRNTEGGPRTSINDVDAFRYVIGARGEIGVNDFVYDVSYTRAVTTSTQAYLNDFNATSIVNAIEGDKGGYDVFTYQGVTQAQSQAMGVNGMMTGTNTLDNLIGYISGTTSAKLPTAVNSIALVSGFESRTMNFERIPDYVYSEGIALGFGGAIPALSGEIAVTEMFAEASIPLIENKPGIQSLVADLAWRKSEYDLTGSVTTNRVGITYQPANLVRFRGGISTAERAPTISSLYYPNNTSLWTGEDGCAGGSPTYTAAQCALTGVASNRYGSVSSSPAGQYYSYITGNDQLKSESADTTTFGMVVNLSDNVTASVDYWKIDIEDAISSPSPETIIELCATEGKLCDLIHRGPTGNLWQVGSGVDQKSQNLGTSLFAGIDFAANASLDVLGGSLAVATSVTKMLDKKNQSISFLASTAYDCVGIMSNDCYPSPEWRSRSSLSFNNGGPWNVGLTYRTMSGIDVDYPGDLIASDALSGSRNWIDVNASYQLLSNTQVTFAVTNLTDEQPPVIGDALSGGYGNTLAANYEALGQYWSLRFDTQF